MLRFPDTACEMAFGCAAAPVGVAMPDARLDAAAHAVAVRLAQGVYSSRAAATLGRELAAAALAAADAAGGWK